MNAEYAKEILDNGIWSVGLAAIVAVVSYAYTSSGITDAVLAAALLALLSVVCGLSLQAVKPDTEADR